MKNLNNFPNPVLINNSMDYNDSTFDVILENFSIDNDLLKLNLKYEIECSSLAEFIKEGKAKAIIKIQSVGTPYREIFEFDNKRELLICINKNNLAKKISIEGYIIASDNIKNFHPAELNELFFKSQIFNIRKGDILALHPGYSLPLDSSELEGPVASIFQIIKNEELKESVDVILDTDTEKINIHLNKRAYESYIKIRSQKVLDKYLAAAIVLPALTEALFYIASDKQNSDKPSVYEDKRWYRQIKRKIEEKKLSFEDKSITSVASSLLGEIVSTALIDFEEALSSLADGSNEIGSID